MKNWLPFVLGPALAMLRIPGPRCVTTVLNKTKKGKREAKKNVIVTTNLIIGFQKLRFTKKSTVNAYN